MTKPIQSLQQAVTGKIVYVATPWSVAGFSPRFKPVARQRLRDFSQASCRHIAELGGIPVSPCLMTDAAGMLETGDPGFVPPCRREDGMRLGSRLMNICSVMVAFTDYGVSEGMDFESRIFQGVVRFEKLERGYCAAELLERWRAE